MSSLFLSVDTTTIVFIVLLVVLIVALLVVPMFTNKKRAKQTEELHRSLQPGDLIKTVGGVIGTIKEIRQVSPVDREMVIETGEGDNKTTMVFDIQALYQVMSRSSSTVPATEEAEASDDTVDTAVENNAASENTVVANDATVADTADQEKAEEQAATTESVDVAEETATETPAEEQATTTEEQKAESKPKAATPAKKKPVNSAAKKTSTQSKNTKK